MTRKARRFAWPSVASLFLVVGACNCDEGSPEDDPAALVVVVPAGAHTTETGGEATFTVALDRAPSGPVTVPVTSANVGEGVVSPATLTFTPESWNAPQTVVVTGVDDDEADGAQTYAIDLGPSTAMQARFAGLTGSATLSNTDDETPGITLSPASGDVREDGTQATLTVVLNAAPTADVTLTLDSDDATEGTIAPSTLTFTPSNWNAPQTVIVTGMDDDLTDGAQSFTVGVAAIASTSAPYAGLALPERVSLSNIDDDTPGFTVSAASGHTKEDGTQATFTVVLDLAPSAEVTVTFATSDASEGTLDVASLTFTPSNWDAPQTVVVTGEDDLVADGDQPFAIEFGATTSDDARYAALRPTDVAMTNDDDDAPGVEVSPLALTVGEDGSMATFTVRLESQPTADVTVHFASNDTTEGITDVTSLEFTTVDFASPQTVTVVGQGDDVDDGDQVFSVVFTATTSDDAAYAAIVPSTVEVTNEDDDSAGVEITLSDAESSEAGDTASFDVVLESEPTAEVTLHFDTTESDEGVPDVTALVFDASNWASPQTVTVTGQNDDVEDGDQPYRIDFTPTTSDDPTYAALAIPNVELTNLDDADTAGITIGAVSGDTTESGGTATFTVVLDSEPTAEVTLTFASNDLDEGVTDITSVTFGPTNWAAPQVVTITGQDDFLPDGDAPYAVVFEASTSDDPLYDGLTPMNVTLTNLGGVRVFHFTGGAQSFVVPNITSLRILVDGAQGGANWVNNVNYGGHVEATFAVTPGETLEIFVGGQATSIVGGFNGGGNGENAGRGGGGASDVRRGGSTLADRIIVAGGGGGAGYWSNLHVVGGVGGGAAGGDGYRDTTVDPGGRGATQSGPGPSGTCVSFDNPSTAGSLGVGGAPSGCGCEGYGGGGGLYGGAGSGNCRGGGGGSGYVSPLGTDVVSTAGGAPPGNGSITILF